jgi:hypothetical protein
LSPKKDKEKRRKKKKEREMIGHAFFLVLIPIFVVTFQGQIHITLCAAGQFRIFVVLFHTPTTSSHRASNRYTMTQPLCDKLCQLGVDVADAVQHAQRMEKEGTE